MDKGEEEFKINYSPLSAVNLRNFAFNTFFDDVVESNKKKLDSDGKVFPNKDTPEYELLIKKMDVGSADFDPVIFLRFVHFGTSYRV
jgi:hypothetical protein